MDLTFQSSLNFTTRSSEGAKDVGKQLVDPPTSEVSEVDDVPPSGEHWRVARLYVDVRFHARLEDPWQRRAEEVKDPAVLHPKLLASREERICLHDVLALDPQVSELSGRQAGLVEEPWTLNFTGVGGPLACSFVIDARARCLERRVCSSLPRPRPSPGSCGRQPPTDAGIKLGYGLSISVTKKKPKQSRAL